MSAAELHPGILEIVETKAGLGGRGPTIFTLTCYPRTHTYCDGCREPVEFDLGLSKIVRECGGVILCGSCRPSEGSEPS